MVQQGDKYMYCWAKTICRKTSYPIGVMLCHKGNNDACWWVIKSTNYSEWGLHFIVLMLMRKVVICFMYVVRTRIKLCYTPLNFLII